MAIEEIEIPYNDASFGGYLAEPDAGKRPGVVVVGAIYGVDDDIKSVTHDLAAAGYPALAPDMFWEDEDPGALQVTPDGGDRGRARSQRMDRDVGLTYVEAAIRALKARDTCNGRIAVMGFCFGGPFVLLSAARLGVDGGVCFHGSHVENYLADFPNVQCPLSFHYGDKDAVAPIEAVNQVKESFDTRDDAELFVYPGGEHGYMFPSRGTGYLPDAAQLSWQRALSFLENI